MIPRTRWARTVDGAHIAYQSIGEGTTALVVVTGWISHLELYWEQPRYVRFMTRLSRSLRVLNFDKRGTGMSDRFSEPPSLEMRADDLRAVMDAADVERAAIFGWGYGGPPSALFFAATHPERTIAVCVDPGVSYRRSGDYPWGLDEEEQERDVAKLREIWGRDEDVDQFLRVGFGPYPEGYPVGDHDFAQWAAKFARYSATPGAYEAFDRVWYATDVRDVLGSIQSPTLIVYKEGGTTDQQQASYLAERIPGARVVGIPGVAAVAWMEDPEPLVSAIERFLGSVADEEADFDRVLSTVVFTDMVRSTELAAELGDPAWKALLERHHETVRALLRRYRGKEIDTAGDGFFASFDGPARAIRCAIATVEAAKSLGLEVRAGVHSGEVMTIDGKIGGIAVNIGARIGGHAGPSEVLVSQTVKDLVAGSGLAFEAIGERILKGIPEQWPLYRASAP